MHDASKRRIAVVGGGLAGLEFAVAAAENGAAVEIFEAGSLTRTRHVNWDVTTHVGDEKVRSWTSDNWGAGGGLSERLGGRSLCYHGVLLELEPTALATWGPVWSSRLAGANGLYASILDGLCAYFSELEVMERYECLAALGIRHVPQAARFDKLGRFEAYSPLTHALKLVAEGRIRVIRARVRAVVPEPGGYLVEMGSSPGAELHRGFSNCVLASSAIGNVQILAASLQRNITTTVTDHFCVGAFVRLPPGPSLKPFRHRMLWSGYTAVPTLGMNVFFLERPSLPNGDRLVQLQGVVEQQGGLGSYSKLMVEMQTDGLRSHICASVSDTDSAILDAARGGLRRWAEQLAGSTLVEIVRGEAWRASAEHVRPDGRDTRWFGHDEALEAAATAGVAGVFSQYEVPYGAFEHEACTHPISNSGPVPVSCDLEMVELPGVYVVGPGAFPRLGAANPALTIIALSRWLADHLTGG